MALTLVVIYNPFGNFALPSIVIGAGSLVAVFSCDLRFPVGDNFILMMEGSPIQS